MTTIKAQVVVAGGGPVGRVVSSILSQSGVDTVLVDKRRVGRHPKAHALTCRSMEIFRQIGAEAAVLRQNPAVETWGRFAYVNKLLGGTFGVQEHLDSAAYHSLVGGSLSRPAHVSQPLVEDALEAVTTQLQGEGRLRVLDGYTCEGLDASGAGVAATAVAPDAEGNDDLPARISLAADHLVVCDGANSTLRHGLGVQMRYGPGSLQSFMSIHFHSAKLGRALLQPMSKTPPAMLYFIFNPSVICCLVAHNLERGEFILQAPYYPRYQSPEEFTKERCAELIRQSVEKPEVLSDLEVSGAHPWLMAAQVADQFAVKDKIFIAGDAAHRFPPAGGLGMNTGVADAHNLAWKLAAVHNKQAHASLLRTYEAERRPAAIQLLDTAVDCFHRGMKVPEALGMTREAIDGFEKALKCLPSAIASDGAKQSLFNFGMFAGRHLSYGSGLRRNAIQGMLDNWEGIPLFFSHEDLGISYAQTEGPGACGVVAHPEHAARAPPVLDGTRHYFPSIVPGVRMPLVRLLAEDGTAGVDADEGTTDSAPAAHYAMDNSWWLLLIDAPQADPAALSSAAGLTLRVARVDPASVPRKTAVTSVLVRPDGYIAWVAEGDVTPGAVEAALKAVLRGE